ncbi:MAG TPA: 16S rRNA (uracil(1498)-N(3))-methyltransferase [Lichenihabitans sp.]|jgi:16S rRNA (uracil1498-N3)-methyltransferase|nr:16S rRNA (uracil(1498)-N(3))-methyltransferase [Lichenihabitans sp.]
MPRPDFTPPRLFVEATLDAGARVRLERDQAHYLGHVLRLGPGATVLAFNGRDGEWRTRFSGGKTGHVLTVETCTRPQPAPGDLVYCFAPLKHARLDYLVQKAVEMGADVLQPVITRRTQAARVNAERMRANVIEAAEQCGVLAPPEIRPPLLLANLLAGWSADRLMVFCDEAAETADPLAALIECGVHRGGALGVIVGPEGGFDAAERAALLTLPRRLRLSLGPRILRADTAAVAALALVQATLGDWRP